MDWTRRPAEAAAAEPDSDARAAEDHPRRVEIDPEGDRRIRSRRRALAFALGAAFVAGSVAALFGDAGYLDHRRLRAEVERLERDNARRRARVQLLAAEIDRLEHDAHARERIAREELGLTLPGEIDFLLPPAVQP